MRGVQFKGLTPMGTSLRKKVIDEIVMSRAQSGQLRKPILVIAITDGQPAGEPQNAVFDTIRYAFDTLQQRYPQYGKGALAFEFAQVGNDESAKKFLGKLDEDPVIGPMVDCTSSTYPQGLSLSLRDMANDYYRLRERARRDVAREPTGRSHTRPLDRQAPPRRHRRFLRLQRREDEQPTARRLRRPTTRPIRCSSTRPVRRPAPRPVWRPTPWSGIPASAGLRWPSTRPRPVRCPASGRTIWCAAAGPGTVWTATAAAGWIPRPAAVRRPAAGWPLLGWCV